MSLYIPRSPDQSVALTRWVEQRLPDCAPLGPCQTLGILTRDGKRLAAVAAYNNYREGVSCEGTIVAESAMWATHDHVSAILAFPFVQLRVRVFIALTSVKNKRSQKLLEGVGFKLIGTMPDMFDDGPGRIYAMTRRWWLTSKWCPDQFREAA